MYLRICPVLDSSHMLTRQEQYVANPECRLLTRIRSFSIVFSVHTQLTYCESSRLGSQGPISPRRRDFHGNVSQLGVEAGMSLQQS